MNPSGRVVWVARFRDPGGRIRRAKPDWNGRKATFHRRRDAQRAIDEALASAWGVSRTSEAAIGGYLDLWIARHPRSERTNRTNRHRIQRVLDVPIDGRLLRDWKFSELRRRDVLELHERLLVDQGRAVTGAIGILRSLSAMTEDAITDEVADVNPFKGLRIRRTDPRARRVPRETRVWSFEQMHRFASDSGRWEAMIRTFSDTGLRLGEVLPLQREDWTGECLHVRRTAHEGQIQMGTKRDHGYPAGGRVVPCPPGLAELLGASAPAVGLLFPTPTGLLWRERNFYRDVWHPTQRRSGMDIRPHEMRHSYITHLRARGVDDADLARIAGHRVETMLTHYVHPLGRDFERVREVIG